MNRDRLADRLLATFVAELAEQLGVLNTELLALESAPDDQNRLRAVFRVAHTLKGAARAAAVPLVEQVCHALETFLAEARDGKAALTPHHFQLLFTAADALGDAAGRLKEGRPLDDSPLARLAETLGVRGRAAPALPHKPPPQAAPGRDDGQVRVSAGKLDALLATASDLLVSRGTFATRAAEVQGIHESAEHRVAELRAVNRRVRLVLERSGASRAAEALTGAEHELRRVVEDLSRLSHALRDEGRALERAVHGVVQQVRDLRMRPFAEACEALPRAVRDLAAGAGKEVTLEITGGDVEADRAVLDGLREALLQLVRNAVDHGIEPARERERAGKPRRGRIALAAAFEGDRIVVTVADDGAGLDLAAVRASLAWRGGAVPEHDRDVVKALFESGVSTRTEVGVVSGRGVGLDIVREAVRRIRGSVNVEWETGRGTRFIIQCPPTLATVRALLVRLGPQLVAIPDTHVHRLLRVRPDQVKLVEGQSVITALERPVRLASLARLLPPLSESPVAGPIPVVLLAAGARRLAVAVDELIAEEEVVLRPLRTGNGSPTHVSGAALLSSGQIALVVSPETLVAAGLDLPVEAGPVWTLPATTPPAKRRILVVDDSLTTRTLEQSVLEAAGYDVLTAVDGSEGWRILQQEGCDLVVADVEMPKMDGFALCQAIRGSKRLGKLPIVLVTALEEPEHRARGLEVGADAYIGKSSFDQANLLETIQQLLG